MKQTEAEDLAGRIAHTWPGRIHAHAWIDDLADLDAGRAGTTLARLRRTEEHAPSIARFHAAYRAVNTTDASTHRPTCDGCDGTGHIIIEGPQAHRPDLYADHGGQPCTCHHATPCRTCQHHTTRQDTLR